MNINDIMWGCISTAMIVVAALSMFWYDNRKPKSKPRIAICAKCKYVIQGRWRPAMRKISCRNPNDPTSINFVTGKKAYPTFNCELRNRCGTCKNYKKKWWKL